MRKRHIDNLPTVKWDPATDTYRDESKVFNCCGNSLEESRSILDEAVFWGYKHNLGDLVFIAPLCGLGQLSLVFDFLCDEHPVTVCGPGMYVMSHGYVGTPLGQFSFIQGETACDEILLTRAKYWCPYNGVGDWNSTCRIVNWR
jgi:hypothetical protein